MQFHANRVPVYKILAVILWLPVAAFIYILSPLLRIRFGRIDSNRLGFMAYQPDVYFFNKKDKLLSIDIFYFYGKASNLQLKKMIRRILYSSSSAQYIAMALKLFPGSQKHFIDTSIVPTVNYAGYIKQTLPQVQFTEHELEIGLAQLRRLGISADSSFICFSNRDATQFKTADQNTIKQNEYRNFSIDDLKLAIQTVVTAGHYAVRMGISENPLSWTQPRIIDYSTRFRTDFLDIFLLSRCRFYLGPNSGPYVVSELFRRPVALLNLCPLTGANGYFSYDDLFIPKKYMFSSENRMMSIKEIIRSGAQSFLTNDEFIDRGISLVSNSAEEINELVIEMDARLSGKWVESKEDIHAQKRFQDIIRSETGISELKIPRICASFLRSNMELLN